MSALKFENWIAVSFERANAAQQSLLGIEKIIYREQSPYQEVVIADVPQFGRALFLDCVVQVIEQDEFIYHEHLALLPLLYHCVPERVLILGGGDGMALREVLRDSRVKQATLVDLDGQVVQACRQHLAHLNHGSFDHPKARVVIDDARRFLAANPQAFDVAIVDLVDPYGEEGIALYNEVTELLKSALAPGALISTHGSAMDPPGYLPVFVQTLLRPFFEHVVLHRAYVPSFMREWGFLLASDQVDFMEIQPQTLQERARHIAGSIRSFRPVQYPAAFHLPPYLAEAQQRIAARPQLEQPRYDPQYSWIDRPEGEDSTTAPWAD